MKLKKIFISKLILAVIFIFAFILTMANTSFAQGQPAEGQPAEITPFDSSLLEKTAKKAGFITEGADKTTLAKIIGSMIFGLLSFLGVAFVSLMIYGGYRWLTARGNEQNVSSAKEIIRNAIIGTIITAAAYGIWQLIETYVF